MDASGQDLLAADHWEQLMNVCKVPQETIQAVVQPAVISFADHPDAVELQAEADLERAMNGEYEPSCVVRTLYEHTAPISCLWGRGAQLLSGSQEGDVWYHNMERDESGGHSTCKLAQHNGAVSNHAQIFIFQNN